MTARGVSARDRRRSNDAAVGTLDTLNHSVEKVERECADLISRQDAPIWHDGDAATKYVKPLSSPVSGGVLWTAVAA